jgi:hypothetical protein
VDAYTNQFLTEYTNTSKPVCFAVETTGSSYFGRDLCLSMRRNKWIILILVTPFSVLTSNFALSYHCYANLWTVWIIPSLTNLTTLCVESMIGHFLLFFFIARLSIVSIFAMILFSVGVGTTCYMYLLFLYSDLCCSHGNCSALLRAGSIRRGLKCSGSILMASFGIFLPALFLFLVFPTPILQDVVIGTLFGVSAAVTTNCTMIPILLAYTSLGKMIISPRQLSCVENRNSIRNVAHHGLINCDGDIGDVLFAQPLQENQSNSVLAERYRNDQDQSSRLRCYRLQVIPYGSISQEK